MKGNKIRKVIIFILFTIITSTFLLSTLALNASADGQAATFDSLDIKAIPPVQGVGGEVKIEATANFYGGCCYHLYANDVNAELFVPEDAKIISSLPESISEVDAVPGGKGTTKSFKWTITSDKPGIYELKAKVSTSNCGSKSNTILITIVEGASISNPTIFPSKPSVGESITFSAEVRSGNDFVEVEETTLYIWRNENDYNSLDLIAEENRVYRSKASSEYNLTSENESNIILDQLGTGKKHAMSKVEFTNTWRNQLKNFDKEENIYYWFNVHTSDGKNITSFVYKLTLEDLEKKYQMIEYVKWGTFSAIVIGVVLILGLSWIYLNRPAEKIGGKSVFILGSTIFSKPSERSRSNVSLLSMQKYRFSILILVMIILLMLIIASLYMGLFQELITETGG